LRLACQHGKTAEILGQTGQQRGNLGAGLLTGGHCLFHIEGRCQPGLRTPTGDLQGFHLGSQIVARDGKARLQAAQFDIGHSDLSHHGHLHLGQTGLRGLRVCFCSIHSAVLPTEDIGLPARIKAGLKGFGGVIATRAASLGRCRHTNIWPKACGLAFAQSTRLLQRGACRAHFRIGLQCLRYQRSQLGVIEPLPPLRQIRAGRIRFMCSR
jgi:hypothetical protein